MIVATQIDQRGANFDISGPIKGAMSDANGNRYLVIQVWTPWGQQDAIVDLKECKIEEKRLN